MTGCQFFVVGIIIDFNTMNLKTNIQRNKK